MKAFISYSHEDDYSLKKLIVHLAALRRQGLIEAWTDHEIHAGGDIDESVRTAMDEAQLFLLLVSASFIHSDYCFEKEFARALERQASGEVIIVPIVVRECDWKIPELRKFKALPKDGKAVISRHWHSEDEAFANISEGLRVLLEKSAKPSGPKAKPKPSAKFVPDDRHVTEEQRAALRKIHEEIVQRLGAKASKLPEEEAKKKNGKLFGIIWGQFNDHFDTKENGLQSLPREKFDEAKSWLQQYRGSTDKKLKRVNPQAYRNTLTKAIYSLLKPLGWSKEELYAFASEKVGYADPITSLNDLGNNQLELVRDRVRYEATKRKTKSAQTKAKRAPKFVNPSLAFAIELLEMIQQHPNEDERGLTEILHDSPTGPLYRSFIPNTTAAGAAPSVKKSLFGPAVAELVRLGWLLQPEGNSSIRIYELNPEVGGVSS